jgi:hypothetical protein
LKTSPAPDAAAKALRGELLKTEADQVVATQALIKTRIEHVAERAFEAGTVAGAAAPDD